jgi:hypothetical protein
MIGTRAITVLSQTYHRFLKRLIFSPERMLSQVLKEVLGRVKVNWSIHLWTVQFLLDDITTFNIGFPIPYTLQLDEIRGMCIDVEDILSPNATVQR